VGGQPPDNQPCSDDFDYVGGPASVGNETDIILTSVKQDDVAIVEAVELRARGQSAAAEELEILNSPKQLRPQGFTGTVEEMVIETPVTKVATIQELEELPEMPIRAVELGDGFVKELKEIAPPVEMVDIADDGQASSSASAQKASLFNPSERLFDTAAAWSTSDVVSTARVAQNRLRKLSQMREAENDPEDEDGDFHLASSVGVQGLREYQPGQTKGRPIIEAPSMYIQPQLSHREVD
jgi:hypothetical protein